MPENSQSPRSLKGIEDTMYIKRLKAKAAKKNSKPKKPKKTHPQFQLSAVLTVLIFIFIALFIGFSSTMIQPGAVIEQLKVYFAQPKLFVLNGLPIVLFMVVLFAINHNIFITGAISVLVFDILSYVNLLKIDGRNDPFVPTDITLMREGLTAAGDYKLDMHLPIILYIAFSAAAFFILGRYFKSPRPSWTFRVSTAVLAITVFVVSMNVWYSNNELYDSFDVPERYNISSVYNTLGFQYCFLHNYNLYPVEKPAHYSSDEVKQWEKQYLKAKSNPKTTPNVIFIMCEAFTDISNDKSFAYSEKENPLYLYNQLAKRDQVYSGNLIVSNFGAGTANTEFDILTGMPTNMLAPGTTSAFRTVRHNTNALPRLFASEGYQTYFMHPGDSWFYNRSSVYSFLGIDNQVFKEDAFNKADSKGNMLSDEAFLRVLKNDFSNKDPDSPFFGYTVTIQNHQAYTYDKYSFKPDDVPLNVEVSDTAKETLAVYMEGIRDSSAMLYEFANYLNLLDEPTILVFFGDHLPNLGPNYGAYAELGLDIGNTDTPESTVNTYRTPFMILANQAYCDVNDFGEVINSLNLPENSTISDHYLGAAICEMIGYNGRDPYIDFLNTARRELPVICNGAYMLPDGKFTYSISEKERDVVDKTEKWEYYRMKDEALLFPETSN